MANKSNTTTNNNAARPSNGMRAVLKNYRQSPRKVRLLADLVRGKKVEDAMRVLQFTDKRASGPFMKVIRSAVANATQAGADPKSLVIKQVRVDKAATLRRFKPRARGNASPINRRSSHIIVELSAK